MATGPLEERGKDVEGHVRDALKAVAFLKEGRLSGQADTARMGRWGVVTLRSYSSASCVTPTILPPPSVWGA
jgi:hypothetical protein